MISRTSRRLVARMSLREGSGSSPARCRRCEQRQRLLEDPALGQGQSMRLMGAMKKGPEGPVPDCFGKGF